MKITGFQRFFKSFAQRDVNGSQALVLSIWEMHPKDKTASNAVLYGLAMTSDGKHVWWTQIQGNLGSCNTETLQVETVVEFPMGTGPRLAIDEHDVAWVPLYGASQLLTYDTKTRKEIARYNMPSRSAASYNVTWDPVRKVVWCRAR